MLTDETPRTCRIKAINVGIQCSMLCNTKGGQQMCFDIDQYYAIFTPNINVEAHVSRVFTQRFLSTKTNSECEAVSMCTAAAAVVQL